MKRILKILIILIVLLIIVRGGYWMYTYVLYDNALERQKERWINETFLPSTINGIIYELNEPTGENCFSNLIIQDTNGEKFASGVCLCESNQAFAKFVAVGDSVYKPKGSDKILIFKSSGEKNEFDFPFCDD